MYFMNTLPRWLLIFGLAFVFGYFGIDKLIHPELWTQWMPVWMDGLMGFSTEGWVKVIGIVEIILAAGLVIPWPGTQRIAAGLSVFHLAAILTQTGWNDIAVRDIGLLAMALALTFSSEER